MERILYAVFAHPEECARRAADLYEAMIDRFISMSLLRCFARSTVLEASPRLSVSHRP
ncbi:MAG: hypothetical protein M0Q23_09895 [Syntrophales bacterium]|jgi:hypothetical protein|nr:hypothetical protein [Syntrophales bacterium]MCK9528925.1 hypothetical protein [Syntrophales bacterium]MDX9921077.1 hypothetical protein [Syntrophales bacterium]